MHKRQKKPFYNIEFYLVHEEINHWLFVLKNPKIFRAWKSLRLVGKKTSPKKQPKSN